MTGFLAGLECSRCAAYYPGDTPRPLCDCGGVLLARYDLAAIRKAVTPDEIARRAPTMWRYRELLPVRDDAAIVTIAARCPAPADQVVLGDTELTATWRTCEPARKVTLKVKALDPDCMTLRGSLRMSRGGKRQRRRIEATRLEPAATAIIPQPLEASGLAGEPSFPVTALTRVLVERHRPDQQRVDEREHRRGEADADGEHRDGEQRRAGPGAQTSPAVTQVVNEHCGAPFSGGRGRAAGSDARPPAQSRRRHRQKQPGQFP